MKKGIYTQDLDDKLGDMGFVTNPDLAIKECDITADELVEDYKIAYRAMKLLLISQNIDEEKLAQAMDLAAGMK